MLHHTYIVLTESHDIHSSNGFPNLEGTSTYLLINACAVVSDLFDVSDIHNAIIHQTGFQRAVRSPKELCRLRCVNITRQGTS